MTRKKQIALLLTWVFVRPTAAQFPSLVDQDYLDGRAGFTVYGNRTQEFGWTAAGVGDVNADGIDDFASGGPGIVFDLHCEWPDTCQDCVPTAGAVNVIFGRPGIGADGVWNLEDLDEAQGLRIVGVVPEDSAGHVSAAGDFDNDGFDDFLVGADDARPFGITSAGEAYMIYGGPDLGNAGTLYLSTLSGTNGFTMRGLFSLGGLGRAMASIGDFDGDGVDDVALGAPGADPWGRAGAGQVYVLFGGHSLDDDSMILPLDLDAEHGIIFNGIAPDDVAGFAVDSAGDFNGDGLNDLLISAKGADPAPDARGQVYVIYGGLSAGDDGVFELADVNGVNGFAVNGPVGPVPPGPQIGRYVAGVGDINDDGFDDIAVSVDWIDDWVGVIFGGPNVAPDGIFCLEDLNGENGFRVVRGNGTSSSSKVYRGGDLNHDGIDDLFVKIFGLNLIYGGPNIGAGGVIEVPLSDDTTGFMMIVGSSASGRVVVGDVNNDGITDIASAGEHYVDECDVGRVGVVFGRRMGDGDLDADVDFLDFGAFQRCFRSELFDPEEDPDVPDACHPFDFDRDNDVDADDYAAFQSAFGTPP